MSLVSFVRVESCNDEALKRAVEKSLDLIHFNFERNVDRIVIKPNMCYYYHPSTGEITDPRFTSALIDVLRNKIAKDPEIFVVESDASAMKCNHAFRMLGYDKVAKEKGVKLVNLSQEKNRIVDILINDWYFRFRIPETVNECDLFVNVPKMKYMDDVKITCALKNVYGCNTYPRKSIYHTALNEAIVGINKLIKTDLVIVDGLVVSGKNVKRLGLVMASEDIVATDAVASKLMGIDPKSVKQIVLASKAGIGNLEFTSVGEPFSYFEDQIPKKGVRDKIFRILTSLYFRIFRDQYN